MTDNPFEGSVSVLDGRVDVRDERAIASPAMDRLVYTAVFGNSEERDDARWLIWELGKRSGCSRHRYMPCISREAREKPEGSPFRR